MTACTLQTATATPRIGLEVRSWLSGLVQASRDAWSDYRCAKSPAERHQRFWLFVLYLSAAILPGGALLLALRWFWLRMHM